MSAVPPARIETARLVLRRPARDAAPALFARCAQDPEVTRHLTWRPHRGIATIGAVLRRCLERGETGMRREGVLGAGASTPTPALSPATALATR